MSKNFPNLFSPIKIGNVTFKNRITFTPMSIPGSYEGWFRNVRLSQQGMEFFLEKAKGGAGCVTVGEIDVSDDFFQNPVHFDMLNFATLARGIKDYGAVASLEIGCRGLKDYNDNSPDAITWGPVDKEEPDEFNPSVIHHKTAMTEEDMKEVAERFANAVEVCKKCCYDMVMIHGGHGFLLSQFVSPQYNKRTDKYGGSTENRARFPLMVLKAIRDRVGNDMLIEYRISADEFAEGGMDNAESIRICKLLSEYVDIIHATAGSPEQLPDANMISSVFKGRTPNLSIAAALTEALEVPVNTIGAYFDPAEADAIIAEGKADLICFGRQSLADPHFPNKALEGRLCEINTCLRCYGCMSAPDPNLYATCVVNPTVNYEFIYPTEITPSLIPKTFMVIGGGPAGMTAAVTAYDRGHRVTLIEKKKTLGGIINFADSDYYKERVAIWKKHMIERIKNRDIEVKLGCEATPELIEWEAPDVVIMAAGSEKLTPPIPGIENALHVLDIYGDKEASNVGKKVVFIGGGLAGCEAGVHLAALGREVTLLELKDELAEDAYPLGKGPLLFNLNNTVKCLPNHECIEVSSNGVKAVVPDGSEKFFEADTVVYALGMKSRDIEPFRKAAPYHFIPVGDCVKPAKLMEAIHTGYFAAVKF